MIETGKQEERAILIGINYPGQEIRETEEYIDELSFLAETAGAIPVKRYIQKLTIFLEIFKLLFFGRNVSQNF